MNNKPKNEKGGSQEPTRMEEKRPRIMTQPLPQILDDLEEYTKRVEEAARQAREAAAQAKASGERAAEAARKAAEAAVAAVREEANRATNALREETNKATNALGARVSTLETELSTLKENVTQEAQSLDKAFVALKNSHVEGSPFLKKQAGKS